MANPLLNKMSNAIVNNAMKNNPFMNLINMARNGSNPQALINTISQSNPQVGNQLQQLMSSGQDPRQILNNMMANRSPLEIENFKNALSGIGFPKDKLDEMFGSIKQEK